MKILNPKTIKAEVKNLKDECNRLGIGEQRILELENRLVENIQTDAQKER